MPVLHKYKENNAHYVLTSIKGKIITFQITPEGYSHLKEAGVVSGKPFNRFLLLDIYRMGFAFTGHTGFEMIPGQGMLDFFDDPEPETMFPSCSVCSSQDDLHLVEAIGKKHYATIFCVACRKKELASFDTSIPLPLVTRSLLSRFLTTKNINDIDKSVSTYQDLLNAEFSDKWKEFAEKKARKPAQESLISPKDQGTLI